MCVCVCLYCMLVCVRTWQRVHVFLTSLLRHSSRESGVKWKSGSHSVGIHGSGPRGPVRAPVFTDKASPAGPRHTHTEKGSNRRRGTQERGRQGNKGRENGEGAGGGNGRRSVWRLPILQECRCDGLSSKTGPTQTFPALSSKLFYLEKKKPRLNEMFIKSLSDTLSFCLFCHKLQTYVLYQRSSVAPLICSVSLI